MRNHFPEMVFLHLVSKINHMNILEKCIGEIQSLKIKRPIIADSHL
jgi:hypothetical protein